METILPRPMTQALLLTGPLASCAMVQRWLITGPMADMLPSAVALVLLFWLPVGFFTVPAILTQDARDAFEPAAPSVVRAVKMLPWLFSRRCPVATENFLALAGVAVALAWASTAIGLGTIVASVAALI